MNRTRITAHVIDASHDRAVYDDDNGTTLRLPIQLVTLPYTTTMAKWWATFALLALHARGVLCGIDQIRVLGPQAVNLWKLNAARTARSQASPLLVQSDGYGASLAQHNKEDGELARKFPEHWFEQPLDHFASGGETWRQRYWLNTRHYVPGPDTPVFVLDGGETSGEDRLPFLDTGIMEILARATGGIGIVLEHRCVHCVSCSVK